MKVLPLVLILLVVIALAVREEVNTYKIEKMGRIGYLQKHLEFREGAYLKEEESPKVSRGGKEGEKKDIQKTAQGTRELNILPLVDPNEFSKDQERTEITLKIVQRLIDHHFAESPLYQELVQEDPNLVPHFFEAVRDKCGEINFKFGNAKWSDLALLQLDDKKLQLFLYEFLKGEKLSPKIVEKAYDRGEKIPLMNSLIVDKSSRPLRLFIASPPLLKALSEKDDIDLSFLLDKRKNLSKLLKKEKSDRLALSREWEEALKTSGIDISTRWATYEISSTKI